MKNRDKPQLSCGVNCMEPAANDVSRDVIEAEARSWVIRLDGGALSPEETLLLGEWARRSPAHGAALREMAEMWDALDALAALEPIIASAPEVKRAVQAVRRPARRHMPALAAAAALLVVAAAGWFAYMRTSAEAVIHQTFATSVGEQRTVTLADGSEVRLNTDSAIEVAYNGRSRRVGLVRGEALFDVASDARRPFVVFADGSAVRAVGTVFAVRAGDAAMDVVVVEGLVDLIAEAAFTARVGRPATRIAALQAAERIGDGFEIRDLDARGLERAIAWSEGALLFDGETLAEALREVERYTTLTFEIVDPEVSAIRMGGRYPIEDDVEEFLDVLQPIFGVHVEREGDRVMLSRADTD